MIKRKLFSIFGLVALAAFFMPWLKACDQAKSGFQLTVMDSVTDISYGSLSSLNTGLLFLLIPLFFVFAAWIGRENRAVKISFGVLAMMSLVNIGVWGGMLLSAVFAEWGTEFHAHAIKIFRCVSVLFLSAIFMLILLMKWYRRRRVNLGWGTFVLAFQLFGPLFLGLTFEPNYYGIWIYLAATVGMCVGGIWDGILETRSISCSDPTRSL